jgi:hypothetical protein
MAEQRGARVVLAVYRGPTTREAVNSLFYPVIFRSEASYRWLSTDLQKKIPLVDIDTDADAGGIGRDRRHFDFDIAFGRFSPDGGNVAIGLGCVRERHEQLIGGHCHCVDCQKSSRTGHTSHMGVAQAAVSISGETTKKGGYRTRPF